MAKTEAHITGELHFGNGTFEAYVSWRGTEEVVRITSTNRNGETRTTEFSIGSKCEVGSYNLIYVGTIVAIGPKTVTMDDHGRKIRWSHEKFIRTNHDFDLKRIQKHNSIESMNI